MFDRNSDLGAIRRLEALRFDVDSHDARGGQPAGQRQRLRTSRCSCGCTRTSSISARPRQRRGPAVLVQHRRAAGLSDRGVGCRPRGVASIWVRVPRIKGNARQENQTALGQGRRRERVERQGGVQRVERLPQRLAHERAGAGRSRHARIEGHRHDRRRRGSIGQARHFPGQARASSAATRFRTIRRRELAQHRSLVPGREAERHDPRLGQRRAAVAAARCGCSFAARRTCTWTATSPTSSGESRAAARASGFTSCTPTTASTARSTSTASSTASRDAAAETSRARPGCGSAAGTTTTTSSATSTRCASRRVARSADWIKLQYENQKPLQTLVGPRGAAGQRVLRFADAEAHGRRGPEHRPSPPRPAARRRSTGSLKRDGHETRRRDGSVLVHVRRRPRDGRHSRSTLQFKAIYANEVKTKDIADHDQGRHSRAGLHARRRRPRGTAAQTIEVVPQIANLERDAGQGGRTS